MYIVQVTTMRKNLSGNKLLLPEELRFQNVTESRLTIHEVYDRILNFMASDPRAAYHFVIGTDSQGFNGYTKFVTGIIIRRMGKGAWACYRQVVVPRELTSLKEKLTMETALSQEVAYYFVDGAIQRMEEVLLPFVYQGASLDLFIDIDAGTEPTINKTSLYVEEMIDRVKGMGTYLARVKPDSYAASAYANRHTKKPVRFKKRQGLV
ncbi:ribonuclease H-like YkuK family protein [Paenibacillus glycanilyticus]|uniref:ribonuclease H-like YkuK family protein n=1 Tax=Paenibacillus glycanilyticus TaxID=126569 RepID=UPI000FD88A8C|nr:ribonuclease H-like YkuK family protein [Paenibacillus glycanilyticus]